MQEITELISKGSWDAALVKYTEYTESRDLNEEAYIVGAAIMEHYQEWDTMFAMIQEGLKLDPSNYELYLMLGNYYSVSNPDQAYLAYENALYFSQNAENTADKDSIEQLLYDFRKHNQVSVRNVSFIILSYNTLDYTKCCIESIRNTCFDRSYEIIVVDNASNDGSVEWLREQNDIMLVENKENTGFPRGCNQGIKAACPDNDILLLNNDTILLPNSLYWLRTGLYSDLKTGAAGSVTNHAANDQVTGKHFDAVEEYLQFGTAVNIPMINPYELKSFLVMFAMLIKREALNKVGFLDERFTPGNFEDNDYGMRLMQNGYNCVLCHNSYIFHFGSKSFGKDVAIYNELFLKNRDKFKDKWGFYSDSYTCARMEMIGLLDIEDQDGINILEIGCGLGETLGRIRFLYPQADVRGIESKQELAALSGNRFDVRRFGVEDIVLDEDEKYDCIILTDILGCLLDPKELFLKIRKNLKENGYIIANVPNLMNAAVIHDILTGKFTYGDEGIVNKKYLRFYTLYELKDMFFGAGYEIEKYNITVSPDDSTSATGHKDFFNQLLKVDGVLSGKMFDVYQFIVRAKIRKNS